MICASCLLSEYHSVFDIFFDSVWKRPFKTWQDGTRLSYKHWAPGEPNNHGTDGEQESCVEQFESADWNDVACRKGRFFVCNYRGKDRRKDPLTAKPDGVGVQEAETGQLEPWKCNTVQLDGVERKECLRRRGSRSMRRSRRKRRRNSMKGRNGRRGGRGGSLSLSSGGGSGSSSGASGSGSGMNSPGGGSGGGGSTNNALQGMLHRMDMAGGVPEGRTSALEQAMEADLGAKPKRVYKDTPRDTYVRLIQFILSLFVYVDYMSLWI